MIGSLFFSSIEEILDQIMECPAYVCMELRIGKLSWCWSQNIQINYVNTLVANALAPSVAWTSAPIGLTVQNR